MTLNREATKYVVKKVNLKYVGLSIKYKILANLEDPKYITYLKEAGFDITNDQETMRSLDQSITPS